MNADVRNDRIENRGTIPLIDRKKALAATMHGIKDGSIRPTHYMKQKLIDQGFITESKKEIEQHRMGRPPLVLKLTTKGQSLANLHMAWKAQDRDHGRKK